MTHRVWKFGSDIDTDALAPGAYMKQGIDVIAAHCLESIRPEFAAQVERGDVVVGGPGFGIGSSREQAAAALEHLGVAAVISPSYSGLFFRNAFNLGLLLLTCADIGEIEDKEQIDLDLKTLVVTSASGKKYVCEPIPQFLLDMAQAGGLMNTLKKRMSTTSSL